MSGSRQISPTYRRAAPPPVSAAPSARRVDRPVVFGAAAVFGCGGLGRRGAAVFGAPLAMLLAGLEGIGRCDAGPGFAAAEEAQHAALDLEMVGIDRLDRRTVDLARPWRYRLGLPTDRRRASSSCRSGSACRASACSVLRHRDCACRGRPASFPRQPRPTCCRCIVRPGCWRRHRRPSSRRWDRARKGRRKTCRQKYSRIYYCTHDVSWAVQHGSNLCLSR